MQNVLWLFICMCYTSYKLYILKFSYILQNIHKVHLDFCNKMHYKK